MIIVYIKSNLKIVWVAFTTMISFACFAQQTYHEPYRLQVHFSPKEHWMNDPNGMVYYGGVYHLFFQYYPDGNVWGPMHWGHATSKDLIHWKQQPIALFPDSLGYIFSGSAVVDENNTSGFGKNGKPPLVAIFTHHYPNAAPGRNDFQNQSIAYSNDSGKTWIKYSKNPVLKNPGIIDFRDPKVMWYEREKKWIMTLATKDRVTFYSSPDLKQWKKESEFGEHAGAHGGVWECPDLFPLDYNGQKVWVLTVSLNPGGPNKGSATQYFTGNFDGTKFIANSSAIKWIDYGPDDYAGVTWSNTGSRKIFLGWMSNWLYATKVPTQKWRNAMTLPRTIGIHEVNNEVYVTSEPVKELKQIETKIFAGKNITANKSIELSKLIKQNISFPCKLDVSLDSIEDFTITLHNSDNEKLVIGFDKTLNQYFIDRTHSGITDFDSEFAVIHKAPRISTGKHISLSIIADKSSVELFADDGLSVMTELFFPRKPYSEITIESSKKIIFDAISYNTFKSIWP